MVQSSLGSQWRDSTWQSFFSEVAQWLLEKGKAEDRVAETIIGLNNYDAASDDDLRRVGCGNYEVFQRQLTSAGISNGICDLLFHKYVGTTITQASTEPQLAIPNSDMHGSYGLCRPVCT